MYFSGVFLRLNFNHWNLNLLTLGLLTPWLQIFFIENFPKISHYWGNFSRFLYQPLSHPRTTLYQKTCTCITDDLGLLFYFFKISTNTSTYKIKKKIVESWIISAKKNKSVVQTVEYNKTEIINCELLLCKRCKRD